MPIGLTLLVVTSILVLFGIGHRVLDRMRLDDKTALLFMAGIFIGGLLPDISLGTRFSINIGGAVIPFILVIYLFVKAGTAKERARAVWASLVSAFAIYLAGRLLPHEPETMLFDPNYAYGIIAGITAYLFGRSRRTSFIAGIMGVLLSDAAQGIENIIRGISAPIHLGSGGALDAVVISGLLAVLLAEAIGELRERLQGGTDKKHMRFNKGVFTAEFGNELGRDEQSEEYKGKSRDSESVEQGYSGDTEAQNNIEDWQGVKSKLSDVQDDDWEEE